MGQIALGAVSLLALEAVGGSVTLDYGSTNAVAAILVSAAIVLATALPIRIAAGGEGARGGGRARCQQAEASVTFLQQGFYYARTRAEPSAFRSLAALSGQDRF